MFENAAQQHVPASGGSVGQGGVISNLLEKLNLTALLEKIGLSAVDGSRIIYFFLASFAIGFLFKKYFKFLLGCIIVMGAVYFVLNSHNILHVDMVALRSFVGYDAAKMDPNSVLNMSVEWIKANVYVFGASLAGFIFGYKLG